MRQRGTRRPHLRPLVLGALCVPLVLLGGCGSDDPPSAASGSSTSGSPSASTDESTSASPGDSSGDSAGASGSAAGPCDLLDPRGLRELAGTDLGEGDVGSVGSLSACQWGSPSSTGVQVVAVPAGQWAAELPTLLDQVKASGAYGDTANARRLKQAGRLIAQGKAVDGDTACGLFSQLARVQGGRAGQDSTVTLLPTAKDPQAISAQTCTDGRYASVLLVRQGLTGSRQQVASVTGALKRVYDAG